MLYVNNLSINFITEEVTGIPKDIDEALLRSSEMYKDSPIIFGLGYWAVSPNSGLDTSIFNEVLLESKRTVRTPTIPVIGTLSMIKDYIKTTINIIYNPKLYTTNDCELIQYQPKDHTAIYPVKNIEYLTDYAEHSTLFSIKVTDSKCTDKVEFYQFGLFIYLDNAKITSKPEPMTGYMPFLIKRERIYEYEHWIEREIHDKIEQCEEEQIRAELDKKIFSLCSDKDYTFQLTKVDK